jgi:hypothetical protein
MMIPGAWESRRRSGAPVNPVNLANPVNPVNPVNLMNLANPVNPELASWIKVSIFAGTLLTAMWLAMMLFFA